MSEPAGYPSSAVERAMKVQEVILRAIDGRLKWYQAAEILGISDRQMRRWKQRYDRWGYDGLFDRRRCEGVRSPTDQQPSPKRVPLEVVRQVLTLYRERDLRLQCAALPGEAAGRARDSALLHLGQDRPADGGAGAEGGAPRDPPQGPAPTTAPRDAAAHRCEHTCLASRPGRGRRISLPCWTMRRARLLRPVRPAGEHPHDAGGTQRGDRAARACSARSTPTGGVTSSRPGPGAVPTGPSAPPTPRRSPGPWGSSGSS